MSNNGSTVDPAVREVNKQMLSEIEHQIQGMMLQCYQAHTLPYIALDLAFEAVRIARFVVNSESSLVKMHIPSLDGATHQLIEALYPIEDEPEADLPLPEAVPDWLQEAA